MTHQDSPNIDQQLGILRVIHIALLIGMIVFIAVVTIMTGAFRAGFPPLEAVPAALLAVGGAAVGLSYVLPEHLANRSGQYASSRQGTAANSGYFAKQLIGLALHEGGAFNAAIACFLQPQAWGAVAGIVALILFALRAPSRDSYDRWAEDHPAQAQSP